MQEYIQINKKELLSRVNRMKSKGCRLAQISATKKEKLELIYSFAKDNDLINLRVPLSPEETIESVSGLYPYAFLYENELTDLFGVKIVHMNIDFHGTLYQIGDFHEKKEEQ